ncbi:MAG: hypothetical protein WHX60_09010 [Armatimonadota bacterium]
MERIREVVASLPEPLQEQVLEYVRQLSQSTALRGIPLKDLQERVEPLTDEEAEAILHAIELGCEQVNPDEW